MSGLTFTNRAGELIGPLTTTWSMPEKCSAHFIPCSTCEEAFRQQECVTSAGDDEGNPQDAVECWPPAAAGVKPPTHPFVGWGFYSPGLACPTGYTSACTAEYGGRSDWEIEFKLRVGETAVGCCPEGYTCTNQNGNTCIATASTSTNLLTAQCSGTDIANIGTHALPDVVTLTDTDGDPATLTRTVSVLAPMFQLNFQSSDMVDPQPTSSSSTPTDADSKTNEESSGLSVGAKAGIGVGVSAAVLLLLLVAWVFRRKRRQAAARQKDSPEFPPTIHDHSSIGGFGHAPKAELEVPTMPAPPVELPANSGNS